MACRLHGRHAPPRHGYLRAWQQWKHGNGLLGSSSCESPGTPSAIVSSKLRHDERPYYRAPCSARRAVAMSASMLLDTFRNTGVDRHAAELNEGLRPSIQWTPGATTSRPFKKRPPAQVKPEPGNSWLKNSALRWACGARLSHYDHLSTPSRSYLSADVSPPCERGIGSVPKV